MSAGKAFLLKVGDGERVPTFTTVAGLRAATYTITGGKLFISGDGVFTGSSAENRIKTAALAEEPLQLRLAFEHGEVVTGMFRIERLVYIGDFNGDRTYTVVLQGTDKVVVE